MEQLLESIIKETVTKCPGVNSCAKTALEFLDSYSKAPASDYRSKVLTVVTAALESGNSKLAHQTVIIVHKIGKDDRFYNCQLEEDQSLWMSQQIFGSLSPLKGLSSDLQTDYLQALLTLSYHHCWIVSGQICLQVLSLCQEIFCQTSNATTRTAAQNVASNNLSSLGKWLCKTETERGVEDVIPVLQYLCTKIEESFSQDKTNKKSKQERDMLLCCLDTTIQSLNRKVTQSQNFCTFLWRSLCPAIIKLLVRGSGHSLVCSLTSLIGHMESHRPVLEATYHKMLVQTPTDKRLDALKAVSKLLGNSNGLLNLCWLDDTELSEEKITPANDMAILIMLLESLDQCASVSNGVLLLEVVECVNKICEKLHSWCQGQDVEDIYEKINKRFSSLESSDYQGPNTYTNSEDIPEELKFVIQETFSENFDSSSVTTNESDVNQIEVSYDTSDDSDDSEDESPRSQQNQVSEDESSQQWSENIPKSLHSPNGIATDNDIKMIELEKNTAAKYYKLLKNRMFRLNSIRSAIEIDQKIQEFSSQFCQDFSSQSPKVKDKSEGTIMNADGIYLTTYRVVHLNVKLKREGHYALGEEDRYPSISEKEFIDSILGSGILIYLSSTWLKEVYFLVVSQDLFEGCQVGSPIVNLCSDVDGFATVNEYGQLLVEYRRKYQEQSQDLNDSMKSLAGRKYSRRVLSAIWDYIISISSKIVSATSSKDLSSNISSILSSKVSKSSSLSQKEARSNTISILTLLLKISRTVGFQNLSGSVFCLLSNIACVDQKPEKKQKLLKLYTDDVLAMESVLENGLELASHSQDCWKHIFKCCQFINSIEEDLFKPEKLQNPKLERITSSTSSKERNSQESGFEPRSNSDDIWLGFIAKPETAQYENINQIFKESSISFEKKDPLTPKDISKCINHLLLKIEKLFTEASSHLNLMSLLGYLRELCFQSHKELIQISGRKKCTLNKVESFLVTQLSEALLKCIRAGRPMLHLMLAWSVAGPHFMEAASHSDASISKLAIQSIHDIITSLLHYNSEMPHFHFHESLFKPYENLILLDLCDLDTQDQIVASIHQFVEGSSSEIRSGWRPLFGALRSIKLTKLENNENTHIRAILDVFEAFLSTDSPVVFAHAALDCIMCLLKHVKSSKEIKSLYQESEEVLDISLNVENSSPGFIEAALGYIVRCHSILAKLYLLPSCPIFRGAEKIHTGSQPIHVSCVVPGKEVISFDPTTVTLSEFPYPFDALHINNSNGGPSMLEQSGLVRIWFLLIDGIVSALSACEIENQATTINTFFTIMQSLMTPEYAEFGLFCVNHLLLPGIQTWIRTSATNYRGWQKNSQGLKQTIGMATDVILDWFKASGNTKSNLNVPTNLMLRQLTIVLVECTVVNSETIARLGCSCLRHIVSAGTELFSESQWEIVITGLVRASELSLFPAHQLMASFMVGSENFYGDIGTVRVAARRDSTVMETNRIRQLCHQILLLDNQREEVPKILGNPNVEDRSYLFLLQPLEKSKDCKDEVVTIRVTLSELVTGLTAHHILLQTIGWILLNKTKHFIPSLTSVFISSPSNTPVADPIVSKLTTHQTNMLLASLRHSFEASISVDKRPGLKFLLQKVAQIPHAANMYKLTGASWSMYGVTLFELCLTSIRKNKVTSVQIKDFIEELPRDLIGLNKTEDLSCFGLLQIAFQHLCDEYVEIIQTKTEKKKDDEQDETTNLHQEYLESLLKKLTSPRIDDDRDSLEGQSDVEALPKTDNDTSIIDEDENQRIQEAENIIASSSQDFREDESMKGDREQEEEIISDGNKESRPPPDANECKDDDEEETSVDIFEEKIEENIDQQTNSHEEGCPEEKPFSFSDFTNLEPSTKLSESDDSDADMEKAKNSIQTFQMELQDRKTNPDKEQELKLPHPEETERTEGDGIDFTEKDSPTATVDKQSILTSYKQKKPLHMMPPKSTRKNPFIQKQQTSMSKKPVAPEIDNQRAKSLQNDSEAQMVIWNELVCLMLHLLAGLEDREFEIILPAVFPGVQTLTEHSSDESLKKQLTEFYKRVANIYGFSGSK